MGIGTTTVFAASTAGETAESYSVGFPRDGDANLDYSGTWGHDELHYMNGWTSGEATWMTTLHTIGSFDGQACYCIEPGVPRLLGKTYSRHGEDYWKNYPSDCNSTIDADTIKTLLGRIMQYGYQGNLSTSWRSQNAADADKMAHMMATQALVWETVVGERDANFNHVDPGSADAVKSVYRTSHPLYSRFSAYYDSIEDSVQKHTIVPSFMARSTGKAQTVELKLSEIWQLITQSPQTFKGGSIWSIICSIHGALQAIGYALLVLFFVVGVVKTCGSFAELKKPEHAVKLFVRFAIAKGLITYGMELMMAILEIIQGVVSTIMNSAGFGSPQATVLPQEIITAVEDCGFFESIPLWAVTLIGGLFIWVLSFVMILSVYGRFFKMYMYTALEPVPLSAFAGEPTQNIGKSFLKSYASVWWTGTVKTTPLS